MFAGLVGGVGRLAAAVADDLAARGVDVRLGAWCVSCAGARTAGELRGGPTIDPSQAAFDAVVLATPAPAASRLLRDASPSAAALLADIEYASVAIVSLAFATSALAVELAGTGFLVPPVDGRGIKAATFSSRKWAWQAGDVTLVRCSVGRWREEHDLQRPDDDLVRLARADLAAAVGLAAEPIDAVVTRWGGALPQYLVGHLDVVAAIRSAVAGVPGVEVCGAAYAGVGIPAVIADAQATATRVVAGLGDAATMDA